MEPSREISGLLDLMAALRDPDSGCAWDISQTFQSIAPFTIEEAYEVAEAIARGNLHDLRDELGDLLLQVVFHARMAEEQGAFDFGGVVEAITQKLIRRHPHVFGNTRGLSAEAVKALWDEIKQAEKAERAAGRGEEGHGLLSDVPLALPALTRADKLTRKAAKVGFDWSSADEVTAKIEEELAEARAAIASGSRDAVEDEIGDLLFAAANLARHAGIDPEAALRRTNAKFERRFGAIERALASEGRSPAESNLEEMEQLWQAAKQAERAG